MAKKKRSTPGINGSSSADIAFMLLIFFLITTSMDTDKGLQRRLPPLAPKQQQDRPVEINERNIMRLLVNRNDEIVISKAGALVPVKLDKLKDEVVDFILNPSNDPNKPDRESRDIPGLGKVNVITTSYAISLKSEIETSYQMFINVQNELLKAYNEVWNVAAKKYFNKSFEELPESQKKAISEAYPMHISEMPLSNLTKK